MMARPLPALLLPALLLLGAATPGAARGGDAVPAATPVGKPLTCVPIRSLRESLVRSDRIIDFRGPRGLYYRVTLPQACPGLGFERRFSYATSLSQLCAQDVITVLYQSPVMPGASCGLAPFQPVRLAKR